MCKALLEKNSDGMGTRAYCKKCDVVRAKAWVAKNPHKRTEYMRQRRNKNPIRFKAYARTRYLEQKAMGLHLAPKALRKARMRGNFASEDAKVFRAVPRKTVKCFWCGVYIKKQLAHADHVVPIAKGGADAAFNLAWSCPACNMSKGSKNPNAWVSGQTVLELRA